MFRLSSLSYHQVVSLYRGNYTIYGMIKYVNIKIIMTRDLVFLNLINTQTNAFNFI